MTQNPLEPHQDAELARSYLEPLTGDAHDLDPNVLAGWIDGTLEERDAAAVEAALASDPDLRRFASELRTDGSPVAEKVSPNTLRRLHFIIQPEAPISFRGSDRARWFAAAAAVGIAALGFVAGRWSTFPNASPNADLIATATFEVFTDESSDALHDQFLGLDFEEGAP